MVRIRSEHAIGFLKGRFHSLKHLRLRISDESSHKFATYWIAACIGIHAFAMQCEDEEQADADSNFEDPFIAQGLSLSDSDSDGSAPQRLPHGNASQHRLYAAKAKREKLKRALFRAKETRRRNREEEEEELESIMDSSP
jgi:hypothetical protein